MKRHYQKTLLTVCFCLAFVSSFAQVKVYKGNSSYSSDIQFTIRNGKVYKGSSSYSSDVVFTIKDGKLYKGNSNYTSDIFANKKGFKIYKNNSNYSSDVDFTLSGDVTIEQFVAIWYAVKYCW